MFYARYDMGRIIYYSPQLGLFQRANGFLRQDCTFYMTKSIYDNLKDLIF